MSTDQPQPEGGAQTPPPERDQTPPPSERDQQTPPPRDPPPPEDRDPPPLFGITLQPVALVAFVILAAAIAYIGIVTVVPSSDPKVPRIDAGNAYRILTVLVTAAAACAAFAWLDRGNSRMLGRGLHGILDVNKAALAAFVTASLASIAVSIFVALSSLFAGGPEDGVFALASIEFLLKLAAVSAIIVLITLRRPVEPAEQDAAKSPGEGDLQYGSAAFIFSLVVIAALIIPSDDIMRMWSYIFGGEKKLEDYLPSQPFVKVNDDLEARIGETVVTVVSAMPALKDYSLQRLEKEIGMSNLETQISIVLADSLLRQVERRGAWPLLRSVCTNSEDSLLFSNSDNRVLAEHLDFLSTEGIVEYPYGDNRGIQLSSYGRGIMRQGRGLDCTVEGNQLEAGQPQSEITVDGVPFTRTFAVNAVGTTFRLALEPGPYQASLSAQSQLIDPKLELRDVQGNTLAINDDDSSGTLASSLDFTILNDEVFLVGRASSGAGEATLSINVQPPAFDDPRWMIRNNTPVVLNGDQQVELPPEGIVLSYTPVSTGRFAFDISTDLADDVDLYADLVEDNRNGAIEATEDQLPILQSDDDKDFGYDPRIVANLEASKKYLLVLSHLGSPGHKAITVSIDVVLPGEAIQFQPGEQDAGQPGENTPAGADSSDQVIVDPPEANEDNVDGSIEMLPAPTVDAPATQ